MPNEGSGGLVLALLTESFAVRAFVGSLAAAALAGLAVSSGAVRSTRARRLLVVAPVIAAAAAGLASLRHADAYLPQLWVATAGTAAAAGEVLDFLGDLRVVSTARGIDLLLLAYGVTVSALLLRRACGVYAVRRLVAKASAPAGHGYVVPLVHRLARQMRLAEPRVVLLEGCPGGAFTTGVRRPVVALDPVLLDELDARELEGLFAHELAHLKRRDTLVGVLVGVFRDVTFFLPPVHLAVRWLRGEQEESADELASGYTNRPAALASSILKVWDCSRAQRVLAGSCASALVDPAQAVTVRVERLIHQAPEVSRLRRYAELLLAAGVLLAASSAAVVLPRWVASDLDAEGLVIGGLGHGPSAPVESPAFTTFRRLTESTPAERAGEAASVPQAARGAACPCVESRGQLRNRTPAVTPDTSQRMLWSSADQDPWEVSTLRQQAVRARPLWTLNDADPRVGLFVLGRPDS